MSKNLKTNWTTPKTNIISAANDLRKCLTSGYKARLIKIMNEDCQFPILESDKKIVNDFKNYEFSIGTLRTKAEINADTQLSEFEKELSLNYHTCYGEEESVDKYYETGILSKGNFQGMGISHLVKVSDMVEFLKKSTDKEDRKRALLWSHYSDQEDTRHFYDTFRLKNIQERTPKHFNHKLWVVEMFANDSDKDTYMINTHAWYISALMFLIKIIVSPLKFIPSRRVMIMDNYKWITYRIGDVINGYSVEFHIPKKFSFKSKKK